MNSYQDFIDSSKAFYLNIPQKKRQLLVVLSLIGLSATILLVTWAFRPQYRVLFNNLSFKDSGDVVAVLDEENIKYKLKAEGKRILVPAEDIYRIRLNLATKELPNDASTGWELFDQTNLGVTDFVQKLNYHRGLEGELGRTILQLDPVEAVRVHLTMPEESLFRENQKLAMASVTLRLNQKNKLSPAQVEGITYLVSSAVEGLEPTNVTIIDSRGVVLSEKMNSDPVMRLSASQLEIQRQVEKDLVDKGQKLLDMQFGFGHSTLQVTADMDFQQREITRETYDSDNPSIRSEEVTSSNSRGADTTSNSNESTVTNYELNLTRERQVNPVGMIKRLSIAAMVDGTYPVTVDTATGIELVSFQPLADDVITDVSTMIRSALGFNPDRGDEIAVVSVPFQDVSLMKQEDFINRDLLDTILLFGQKIVPLIAVLLLLLTVRNFLKRAQEVTIDERQLELPQLGPGITAGALGQAEQPAISHPIETEVTDEAKETQQINERLIKYVLENSEMAARLVRAWIVDQKD